MMKEIEQNLNGKGLRIGIVQSRFNEVGVRRLAGGLPRSNWYRAA